MTCILLFRVLKWVEYQKESRVVNSAKMSAMREKLLTGRERISSQLTTSREKLSSQLTTGRERMRASHQKLKLRVRSYFYRLTVIQRAKIMLYFNSNTSTIVYLREGIYRFFATIDGGGLLEGQFKIYINCLFCSCVFINRSVSGTIF